MAFRILPPGLAQFLIEGEVDELTPLNAARMQKIKATPCPRCGASLHPRIRDREPFTPDDPLPRMWATCECGYIADAQTGLIIDRGSAAKVQDPLPIVRAEKG